MSVECPDCELELSNNNDWLLHRIFYHGSDVNDKNPNLVYYVRSRDEKLYCNEGHSLTPDNLVKSYPYKRCRICYNIYQKKWRDRK